MSSETGEESSVVLSAVGSSWRSRVWTRMRGVGWARAG